MSDDQGKWNNADLEKYFGKGVVLKEANSKKQITHSLDFEYHDGGRKEAGFKGTPEIV